MEPVTRRDLLRNGALLAAALPALAGISACGRWPAPSTPDDPAERGTWIPPEHFAMSSAARIAPPPGALMPAVDALTDFTERSAAALLRAQDGNVVASPLSIAYALAMTANGARGRTQEEMLTVLGRLPLADLDAGFGAITDLLVARAGSRTKSDGNRADIVLSVANSLWGERSIRWEAPFLDVLAAWFGAGMHVFGGDVLAPGYVPDGRRARAPINAWVSEQTEGAIPELVQEGALRADTRLVLVNAVHLKAPWEQPFTPASTAAAPFVTPAGRVVQAQTMAQELTTASMATGDGWSALSLPYAGRELAMTIVLTRATDAAGQATWLESGGIARALGQLSPVTDVAVRMPRWTFRSRAELGSLLAALGMPTAFGDGADFAGMTKAVRLAIGAVLHEAFIAVDEEGTEASAATAVAMREVSARADPLSFVVDRPFLFVLHDVASKAPLFVGRMADPTA